MMGKLVKKAIRKALRLVGLQPIPKKSGSRSRHSVRSYSQEGEDMVLWRFFGPRNTGFYVDVGAHHPKRFSNTYRFYEAGWNGINIDAMPGSMKKFDELRPRDINIEVPISDTSEELIFYSFNEPALNTFSREEAKKKDGLRDYKVIEEIPLTTKPLSEVIKAHVPEGQKIDFLSVDVEGLDLKVLMSNNWEKHRPTVVVVEDLVKQSLEDFINKSELYAYMKDKGYQLLAKTFNTLFFKDGTV